MLPDHPVSRFHSVRRYKKLFRLGFTLLFLSSLLARSIHSARSLSTCTRRRDFQCHDGQCISRRHHCDGKFDCDDGSDETFGCKRRRKRSVCSSSEYECANGRCIPSEHVCNGDNDCLDFSDESECQTTTAATVAKKKKSPPPAPPPPPPLPTTTTTTTSTPQPCAHNDFRCANNERCISRSFVCDGFDNCGDYSDEWACSTASPTTPASKCPPSITFRGRVFGVVSCATIRKCILSLQVCDGRNDCGDFSDESTCPTTPASTCGRNAHACRNGRCVLSSYVCDGDNDCGDNSDERECEKTCSRYQFQCRNERCVSRRRVCDDVNNCGDYSDELNCPTPVPPQTFQCRNGHIILKSQQCDDHDDCDNDEDDCRKRDIGGGRSLYSISDFCLASWEFQMEYTVTGTCGAFALIVAFLIVYIHNKRKRRRLENQQSL